MCGAAKVAAQETDSERGRVHFESGRSYFDEGNYEAAAPEFQRAYELSHEPAILYNLSLVHERLGNLQLAHDELKAFLDADPAAANRPALEAKLRNFEARIARVSGASPTGEVGQQPHDVTASTPGGAQTASGIPTLAIAGFVAGGVGVLTFAVFGPLALSDYNTVDARCGARMACVDGDLDTAHTFALLADIGLGLAVVGGLVGLFALLLDDDGDEAPRTARARLQVAPVWLDGGGGLSLRGVL